MEYTKKNIITAKAGNAIMFFICLGILAYALLYFFDMASLDWLFRLINNGSDTTAAPEALKTPVMVIAGCIFLFGALIFFSDLASSSKIKKALSEFSEDDVLDQMNNHAAYVYKIKGKDPCLFVTDKYIVCKNNFICNTRDVSWSYIEYYKQTPRMILKLRNNKECVIGSNPVYDKKNAEINTAIDKLLPDGLIIGFDKEQKEAHKERVKASKE